MKWLAITLALVLVALLLAGCNDEFGPTKDGYESNLFVRIEGGTNYDVLVDKQTSVMYWMSRGAYNQGTLTLLVNPDGTPRVWEG